MFPADVLPQRHSLVDSQISMEHRRLQRDFFALRQFQQFPLVLVPPLLAHGVDHAP